MEGKEGRERDRKDDRERETPGGRKDEIRAGREREIKRDQRFGTAEYYYCGAPLPGTRSGHLGGSTPRGFGTAE